MNDVNPFSTFPAFNCVSRGFSRCDYRRYQEYLLALPCLLCYRSAVLPIVRRELQVAARKPSLYWQRLVIGGTAAVVALGFALFMEISPGKVGATMFAVLAWGVFIITLLDGIRCAADSLSWERREGTLGLLFLTDLRSYDIVLGKFSAAGIKILTTLLVTFPILALPLMMGGVTPEEWAKTITTLGLTALFSLCTALFFSAISVSALAAMTGSAVFLGIFVVPNIALPILGGAEWVWLSGPFAMLLHTKNEFATSSGIFWKALAFSLSLSVLMIVATCLLVSRRGSFSAETKKQSWWRRLLEPKPTLAKTSSEMGSAYAPGLWLAQRTLPGGRVLWIITGTGAALCFFVAAFTKTSIAIGTILSLQAMLCFVVKLWMGIVAPQSLHAARTSGALELLLCTPIRPVHLVRGQMEALRKYIFPPAIMICAGFPLVSAAGAMLAGKDFEQVDDFFVMLIGGLLWLVFFLLDYFALAYTGIWFALTSPRIEQAVAKTVGYVLLLPWLLFLFPLVGWIIFFLWPIFWICWASHKVNYRFTERAAEQFARPA